VEAAEIRLNVQDDGRGFDVANARHGPNGIFEGLTLVQQQFAARGQVTSAPGTGTRVDVVFPCLPGAVLAEAMIADRDRVPG
jgi:signal transduction histidine kinase